MAVRFDAASDRVTWTGTAPTPSSGFTVTFWAYVSVDRDDFSTMLRLHASSGATTNLNVAMDSGGVLPCVFTAGGTATGPQALTVASWARVAVSVNGTACTIYVALGTAGATQSQSGSVGANAAVSPNSGYTLAGRAASDSSEWFNGRLAYMRLWSTVLTQAEIEAEWASTTPVRTSLLFAAYPMPDASDLLDHSGNSRHLTAGSTAVTTEDGPALTTVVTATVVSTLPPLTASTSGSLSTAGLLAAALPPLAVSISGALSAAGSVSADLPALSVAVAGSTGVAGQLLAALPAVDTVSAATITTSGAVVNELPAPSVVVDGGLLTGGQLAVSLPVVTGSLAGDVAAGGELAAPLPPLSAALAGVVMVPVPGVVAVELPGLTMASGRSTWPPAVASAEAVAFVDVSGPHEVLWISVD